MGRSSSKPDPSPDPEMERPWRTVPWGETTDILRDLEDPTEGLRILLIGPTGAGKSCFINSVQRVLLGRNTHGALESSTLTGVSFTQTLKTHRIIKKEGGNYPFELIDVMGLQPEKNQGIHTEDIIKILEGCITDGYTFNPVREIEPAVANQRNIVHCVVNILPADGVSRMKDEMFVKLNTVREKASKLGIPQVIVLTKVDKACVVVNKDLKKIYHSRKIQEKVEECSNKIGISLNSIFPVENYHSEIVQKPETDFLILITLRDIVNFANDYVKNLRENTVRQNP